ncbi:MAG: tetratricopeptide repeat protein, partial [Candidatus Omnitrophota bacterium]
GVVGAGDQTSGEWVTKALQANSAGNYDEALACAEKAIASDPNDANAYNARGLVYYMKGQKELSTLAIRDYDMAIKLKPDFAVAYMNRGNAKTDLGLYDSNIEDQNMAIKLSPTLASAYSARGAAYHRKKMYDRAIEDYGRSLELDPKHVGAYVGRGNSYYRSGKYDVAIRDYDQAITMDPNNADCYRYRGRTYLKKGAYDKALVDLLKSEEIKPTSAGTHSYKGDTHLARGEFDLAIKAYDRSIELSPQQTDLNSYFGRGMALKGKGQVPEAVADLKKAVEHAPMNEDYKKELNSIGGESAVQQAVAQAPAELFSPSASVPSASSGPAPSSIEGARVLTPFAGYDTAETCKELGKRLAGVPWREGDEESGPVGSSQSGQYESTLRHTMQGLRLFYGAMTPEEDKSFNAFWAPFFDHPTAGALEYFQKINPLLDDLAVTLNTLDGKLSDLGGALQETLITSEDPGSAASRAARATYESVKMERAKMDDLVKQIVALGNPPNPFASKCGARKR